MPIHGFFGGLGSGKDTSANFLISQKLLKTPKRRIITHVKLKTPHVYMPIDDIFQKAITDTLYFRDSILYLSEFHLIVDARRSSASVNVDFTQNILIQLGKIDCDLIYTAQLLSQIDLRLKQMQKYFYFCNKVFRYADLNRYAKEHNTTAIELYQKIEWDKRIVLYPDSEEPVPFDIEILELEQDGERIDHTEYILSWETLQKLFDNFDTREIISFDRKKYLKT